ncbi:Ankyrin repeat-containing protein [Persephonella hydrogeniphila]|uniref:Ankyrin repeat-containing protein n=1 Tax=Persephonella hydrogeniphila TaxID=198703 RepID=A0A285NMC9_9AQUI|nr:ankyrin repeat domain-containing protein [Persephonella hydrogeniphila]SNZ10388.1 Ankyrin repeat-containing protein [Persephonella hydrogeniphila]
MFRKIYPVIILVLIFWSCQRIDTSDPNNMLIVAAQLGDIDRVRLAIAKGANVNYQDEKGGTALHWAVFYGHKDIVKLLLMQGADPYIKDKNGITPVDVARINQKKEILKILKSFKR